MQVIKDKYIYAFAPDNKAVAKCEAGEIVCFETLDCFGGQIKNENDLVEGIDDDRTNPATGPLYVNGAKKGDVLAVDILDIEVADQGIVCTIKGGGALWGKCEQRTKIIDVKDGLCYFNDICFKAEPMIGVIGTAADDKAVPCAWSFYGGGNMDSRLIRKGVTVYLPVRQEGGLLSMGDVHAAMGDGEVCETGIEIAARIIVRVRIIKDFVLNWPVTETADAWYVNSNGRNCDVAIQHGYEEMHRLLVNTYGWDGTDTTMYLSLQAYVEANQAVLGEFECDERGDTFRIGVPKLKDKPRLIP